MGRLLIPSTFPAPESVYSIWVRSFLSFPSIYTHRARKTPAPEAASYVLRRAREWGVHIQVDGMHENVLKFKPPLAFTARDADTLVATVDRALAEWEQVRAPQLMLCCCRLLYLKT